MASGRRPRGDVGDTSESFVLLKLNIPGNTKKFGDRIIILITLMFNIKIKKTTETRT